MSNILSAMKKRHSVRSYKPDAIDSEVINQLIESVQCSQSWANTQCWELVVATDAAVKKSIQSTVPAQNPAYSAFVDAPMVIVLCAKTDKVGYIGPNRVTTPGDWFMFDAGLATQNLCNVAADLGLGTVVVGWLDHDGLKNEIGLPDGCEAIAAIPVGYPEKEGKSTVRKPISDFVHANRFGQRYVGNND